MKTLRRTKDFTVYKPEKEGTFLQWFSDILGVPESQIEEALKSRCFTDEQIDKILAKGKENCLKMTGWGNFFPILQDGKVCVLRVYRYGGRWYRYVRRLDYDLVWRPEDCLVLSNSGALKLSSPLVPSDLEARVKKLEDLLENIRGFLVL